MGYNSSRKKILNAETYQLMPQYNITAPHEIFGDQKIGYCVRINYKTLSKQKGYTGKEGEVSLKIYFLKQNMDMVALKNLYM